MRSPAGTATGSSVVAGGPPSAPASIASRGEAIVLLLVFCAATLAVIWAPTVRETPGLLALAVVTAGMVAVLILYRRWRTRSPSSRRPSPAPIAWILALLTTLAAAAALVGAAALWGVLQTQWGLPALGKPPESLARWLLEKAAVVAFQQVLLQHVLVPLCRAITGASVTGWLLASAIFSALHAGNPVLMIVTLLIAPIWCATFARNGRLLPVIVSHLILAIVFRAALPSHLHLNLRIGPAAVADALCWQWIQEQHLHSLARQLSSEANYVAQGADPQSYASWMYRELFGREPLPVEVRVIVDRLQYKTRYEVACELMRRPSFWTARGLAEPPPSSDEIKASRGAHR